MDDDSDLNSGIGQTIADTANTYLGSNAYGLYRYSNNIPSGTPKDDAFVNSVLTKAGVGFDGKQPTLSDWTNPSSSIPGWSTVSGPIRPGDVLATQKPIRMDDYSPNGQSLGVATGNGTSIGIQGGQQVAENTFGHEDGHDPIVRRVSQAESTTNCKPQDINGAATAAAGGMLSEGGAMAGARIGAKFGKPMGVIGTLAGAALGGLAGYGLSKIQPPCPSAPNEPDGPHLSFPMPPAPK